VPSSAYEEDTFGILFDGSTLYGQVIILSIDEGENVE